MTSWIETTIISTGVSGVNVTWGCTRVTCSLSDRSHGSDSRVGRLPFRFYT